MQMVDWNLPSRHPGWRIAALSVLLACSSTFVGSAQVQLNVCGCKDSPANRGPFNTLDPSTFPPGTQNSFGSIVLPLPADGILVFKSLNIQLRTGEGSLVVSFARNAANTPVTLLVSGDVTIGGNTYIKVNANGVVQADKDNPGLGSLGGPGGFRGGDAGYQLMNFARMGGAGSGPGGGLGGNDNWVAGGHGANGTYIGAGDLLPLIGGSGGGGGASTTTASACSGGGGGGGGGAILIAADGTITLNGTINADGAQGGSYSSSQSCASNGGGGSGGAVRLVAATITGGTSASVTAKGGTQFGVGTGVAGAIRLEAVFNSLAVSATDPLASRASAPGPIVNPITPTVAITTVGGLAVPTPPGGGAGAIDLVLAAPGPTPVLFTTTGVPLGTVVNVTVKPKIGGAPVTTPVTLGNCDVNGTCLASATFDLAAGAYFIEARATFTTPTP